MWQSFNPLFSLDERARRYVDRVSLIYKLDDLLHYDHPKQFWTAAPALPVILQGTNTYGWTRQRQRYFWFLVLEQSQLHRFFANVSEHASGLISQGCMKWDRNESSLAFTLLRKHKIGRPSPSRRENLSCPLTNTSGVWGSYLVSHLSEHPLNWKTITNSKFKLGICD